MPQHVSPDECRDLSLNCSLFDRETRVWRDVLSITFVIPGLYLRITVAPQTVGTFAVTSNQLKVAMQRLLQDAPQESSKKDTGYLNPRIVLCVEKNSSMLPCMPKRFLDLN